MEKKLMALCVKHGLLTISVGVWPTREKPFSVFVHHDTTMCAMGDGKTVTDAVEAAMVELRARRAA